MASQHDTTLSPQGGDILFIRTGFTAAFDALSPSSQRQLAERPCPDFAGVEATPDVLQWLWESSFAAVAGDSPSFERSPVGGGKSEAYRAEEVGLRGVGSLHEVLLGGWGCPIGEMFDLEGLAEVCRREGRWSFFISSVPLKVRGPCFLFPPSPFFWIAFGRLSNLQIGEGFVQVAANDEAGTGWCCKPAERCCHILNWVCETVNDSGKDNMDYS